MPWHARAQAMANAMAYAVAWSWHEEVCSRGSQMSDPTSKMFFPKMHVISSTHNSALISRVNQHLSLSTLLCNHLIARRHALPGPPRSVLHLLFPPPPPQSWNYPPPDLPPHPRPPSPSSSYDLPACLSDSPCGGLSRCQGIPSCTEGRKVHRFAYPVPSWH